MIALTLHDFVDYDLQMLRVFLELQEEKCFELTVEFDNIDRTASHIAGRFQIMGFAGYLLDNISSKFSYYVPPPQPCMTFKYRMTVVNTYTLACQLNHLLDGIYVRNIQEAEKFSSRIDEFWRSVCANELNPSTWGLLSIYDECDIDEDITFPSDESEEDD